jgi:hypothetical protein
MIQILAANLDAHVYSCGQQVFTEVKIRLLLQRERPEHTVPTYSYFHELRLEGTASRNTPPLYPATFICLTGTNHGRTDTCRGASAQLASSTRNCIRGIPRQ